MTHNEYERQKYAFTAEESPEAVLRECKGSMSSRDVLIFAYPGTRTGQIEASYSPRLTLAAGKDQAFGGNCAIRSTYT